MGSLAKRGLTLGVVGLTLWGTGSVRAATGPSSSAAAVTALLSEATDGTHGNADSFGPRLSADGTTVAFVSRATNLAGAAPGSGAVARAALQAIFVRDPLRGQTVRVSDGPGGAAADGDCTSPALSGDGSVVAFDSFASNLVSGDSNDASDVFVFDRSSGRTTRVSVASDGKQGNGDSFSPSLSADGRFVAFASEATALVPGDHNRKEDVFVFDRRTGETALVSQTSDGKPANGDSFDPVLSADGR
ncbi:MAG TPA: S-layer protein, partial [Acidimicrobiia bacterium]|nr:S-layer protein [Acidimicrobiia bacterium]